MFDNFEKARRGRKPRWVYGILAGVVAFQGMLLLALLAKSWWNLDKLALPNEGVALAVAPPPPTPPAARKGSPNPTKAADTQKAIKRVTNDTTQPVKLTDPVTETGTGERLGNPYSLSDEGPAVGPATGCVGICPDTLGDISVPDPDPCKKNPELPKCKKIETVIPQVAVDKQRIAGDPHIYPEAETKVKMARDKRANVVFTFKMCIDKRGNVSLLDTLKSTGYPEYDAKILRQARQWRYTPFEVNGEPTPVCTGMTIVYRFK